MTGRRRLLVAAGAGALLVGMGFCISRPGPSLDEHRGKCRPPVDGFDVLA